MEQKTPSDIMAEAKTGLMAGKRGIVMGVANDHSIAWGIAQTLASHGAEIAFTYQGDAQDKRLKPLAPRSARAIVMQADVESDEQLDAAFAAVKKEWGTIDFLVHCHRLFRPGRTEGPLCRYLAAPTSPEASIFPAIPSRPWPSARPR